MESEASSPQVQAFDHPLLNFIRQKYVPASTHTATVRLTTIEIAEEITNHMGEAVPASEVFAWLTNSGYTYDIVSDMRFEWLLKEPL